LGPPERTSGTIEAVGRKGVEVLKRPAPLPAGVGEGGSRIPGESLVRGPMPPTIQYPRTSKIARITSSGRLNPKPSKNRPEQCPAGSTLMSLRPYGRGLKLYVCDEELGDLRVVVGEGHCQLAREKELSSPIQVRGRHQDLEALDLVRKSIEQMEQGVCCRL